MIALYNVLHSISTREFSNKYEIKMRDEALVTIKLKYRPVLCIYISISRKPTPQGCRQIKKRLRRAF